MGIVRNQAVRNAVWVSLGVALGAVNNVIVLPRGFADFKEGWGLLKLLMSYALIAAPFVSLGANQIIIRFLPSYTEAHDRKKLLGLSLLLPVLSFLVIALAAWLLVSFVDHSALSKDQQLLFSYLPHLLIIIASLGLFQTFAGYCQSQLETVSTTLWGDTFAKAGYLILGLAFLLGYLSFELFVSCYVAMYALATVIIATQAVRLGFRPSLPKKLKNLGAVVQYGLFNILDKGAAILVNNLDFIMIGIILSIENVADYTLAFFIGAVVIIPQRAIQMVANPLTSKAIQQNDRAALISIQEKSALNQTILGAFVFILIWSNIDGILELLPAKFQGGKWVVFFIGLSKMTIHLTGNNGAIITYSPWYKRLLILNLTLIVITTVSNALLIPHYGIEGAALATLISMSIFALLKAWFVKRKFEISIFEKPLILASLWALCIGAFAYWTPWPLDGILGIICKSIAVALIYFAAVLYFRLSEDLNQFAQKWWQKLS